MTCKERFDFSGTCFRHVCNMQGCFDALTTNTHGHLSSQDLHTILRALGFLLPDSKVCPERETSTSAML